MELKRKKKKTIHGKKPPETVKESNENGSIMKMFNNTKKEEGEKVSLPKEKKVNDGLK